MTREQANSELMQIYGMLSEEKKKALDVLMAQAEKTCDIEKSNFDVRQYKLDTDTAFECGYNAGLQAQADGEKTCGTCRNEDTYHCAECENKSDYEQAQADGEYIDRKALDECKELMTDINGETVYAVRMEDIRQLPTVDIPPEHDGCKDCKYETYPEYYYPCCECKQNYTDEWQKKPHWIEPKTGHWFIDERPESDRETICSNCEQPIFKYHKLDFDYRPKYCPNCGMRMIESQERSEE